jgi:hypothetical protein
MATRTRKTAQFKVGDRVRLLRRGKLAKAGQVGTVVEIRQPDPNRPFTPPGITVEMPYQPSPQIARLFGPTGGLNTIRVLFGLDGRGLEKVS